VRSSKFRHVYGQPARRERCYDNIKVTRNAHDALFCAVNPKFVAVVTEVAGGGAFVVLPINQVLCFFWLKTELELISEFRLGAKNSTPVEWSDTRVLSWT
jgi:Domain of unknown function (DUF1899)